VVLRTTLVFAVAGPTEKVTAPNIVGLYGLNAPRTVGLGAGLRLEHDIATLRGIGSDHDGLRELGLTTWRKGLGG